MKILRDYNDIGSNQVIDITHAVYIENFIIKVSFSDGNNKLVDFKPFLKESLHPSISKYLDEKLFQQFTISNGNLNWNDFDLIFPIHDLYEGKIN